MALTLSHGCPEVCPECVLTAWMVGQTWALVLVDSGNLQTAVAGDGRARVQLGTALCPVAEGCVGGGGDGGAQAPAKAVPPEGTPPHAGN